MIVSACREPLSMSDTTASASTIATGPAPSTQIVAKSDPPAAESSASRSITGASFTFVNVIVAATGPVVRAPSKTDTL